MVNAQRLLAIVVAVGMTMLCLHMLLVARADAQPTQEDAYLRLRQLAPAISSDPIREALWAEAGREVAFLASKRPVARPDLSEYREAMDALVAQHAGSWRALADSYADPVRLAIDGLWMLSEATQEPRYVALAVELVGRVQTASATAPRNFTADLRMYSGFRDVARVARLLGVDPGSIEAGVEEMLSYYEPRRFCCVGGQPVPLRDWATYQHLEPLDMSVPMGAWQGQQSFAARMAPWGDEVRAAWAFDAMDGTWGAGWVEGYPSARSTFKAGREVTLAVLAGLPLPPGLWGRVYDGERFAEFIDGHSRDGFHGATQLHEGWCLLDEARALCRQVIAGTLSGTLGDLNRSTNGTREAAAVGATALGETM